MWNDELLGWKNNIFLIRLEELHFSGMLNTPLDSKIKQVEKC